MQPAPLRVVSLLPSATDTAVALGLVHLLVGRSHEVRRGGDAGGRAAESGRHTRPPCAPLVAQCDAPEVQALPVLTSSRVGDIPVQEIDAAMVRARAAD